LNRILAAIEGYLWDEALEFCMDCRKIDLFSAAKRHSFPFEATG
jgi:hypothetical protein